MQLLNSAETHQDSGSIKRYSTGYDFSQENHQLQVKSCKTEDEDTIDDEDVIAIAKRVQKKSYRLAKILRATK